MATNATLRSLGVGSESDACSQGWGDEVGCHNASHIFVEKNVDGMELLVIELVGLRVWCSCAIRVAVC